MKARDVMGMMGSQQRASAYVTQEGVEWTPQRADNPNAPPVRPPVEERIRELAKALQEAHSALAVLSNRLEPALRMDDGQTTAPGARVRPMMSQLQAQMTDAVESVTDLATRISDLTMRLEL